MSRAVRDAVALHAAFGVVAALVLAVPPGIGPEAVGASGGGVPLGWRLLGLVALYNVALPLVGRARGHAEWVRLWAFLVPLSASQVVPDAVLVTVFETLDFPDTGGPRLGGVPLAMAGMWTIPLWIALFTADRRAGGSPRRGAAVAAAAAGVLLVGAEATLWAVPIWRAVDVWTVGPVAAYVVLPEVALGAAAYAAHVATRDRSPGVRVAAAAGVSALYLAMLAASLAVVEGGWG